MQRGVALNQLSGKTQKVLSVQIPDLCSAFLPAKFEAGAYEMGSCDMLSLPSRSENFFTASPKTEGRIKSSVKLYPALKREQNWCRDAEGEFALSGAATLQALSQNPFSSSLPELLQRARAKGKRFNKDALTDPVI